MEVSARMRALVPVHPDRDPVEEADPRHVETVRTAADGARRSSGPLRTAPRRGSEPLPRRVVENRAMARSKAPPVKIIIDVHERQSGIADTLAELGAEIEIAHLPAGDYAVGADTLVERKRVLDLHAAILKGRLWPQLGALRRSCASPYLLLEGTDIDRGPLQRQRREGRGRGAHFRGAWDLRRLGSGPSAPIRERRGRTCRWTRSMAHRP